MVVDEKRHIVTEENFHMQIYVSFPDKGGLELVVYNGCLANKTKRFTWCDFHTITNV